VNKEAERHKLFRKRRSPFANRLFAGVAWSHKKLPQQPPPGLVGPSFLSPTQQQQWIHRWLWWWVLSSASIHPQLRRQQQQPPTLRQQLRPSACTLHQPELLHHYPLQCDCSLSSQLKSRESLRCPLYTNSSFIFSLQIFYPLPFYIFALSIKCQIIAHKLEREREETQDTTTHCFGQKDGIIVCRKVWLERDKS
jgi:hypothetical protein